MSIKERNIRRVIFITTIILVIILCVIGIQCDGTEYTMYESYVVQSGDTLWSIGKKYVSEKEDVRDYIQLLKKENEGLSADLKVGQVIVCPIE